jgi:hypothetical protein
MVNAVYAGEKKRVWHEENGVKKATYLLSVLHDNMALVTLKSLLIFLFQVN